MELLIAIALGYLMHNPVTVYVDPTYEPTAKEKKEHKRAVAKIAKKKYPVTRGAGKALGYLAATTAAGTANRGGALWEGTKAAAARRWAARKIPATFRPASPPPPATPAPPPPVPPLPVMVPPPPATVVPAAPAPPPPVVLVPVPPAVPPPAPPGPPVSLVKTTPTPPAPPRLIITPPLPPKPPTTPTTPASPATPAPAPQGATVTAEVSFDDLTRFLEETVPRTRDDADLARYVAADDQTIASKLDTLKEQAADLAEGQDVLASITDLKEKCAAQAAKATEYADRCGETAERSATADTNVKTRYAGMASAAKDMGPEGPAMSTYYDD